MKKIIIFISFLTFNFFYGQNYKYLKSNDLKLIDTLKIKLKKDSLVYEHFLFAKRCLCYDALDKKNSISKKTFEWMYNLSYPFFQIIDRKHMIENINNSLIDEIQFKRKQLMYRNEKFYLVANKFILCESISSNSFVNKDLFLKILNDTKSYDIYNFKEHSDSYINDTKKNKYYLWKNEYEGKSLDHDIYIKYYNNF